MERSSEGTWGTTLHSRETSCVSFASHVETSPSPFVDAQQLQGHPTDHGRQHDVTCVPAADSAILDADEDQDLQAALLASMHSDDDGMQESTSLSQSTLMERFERPALVAAPVVLSGSVAAGMRATKDTQVVLEALGQRGVQLVRIRGDGHCLFRAIGASLVLQLCERPSTEECSAVSSHLQSTVGHLEAAFAMDTAATGQDVELLDALLDGTLHRWSRERVLGQLAADGPSDRLVKLMRQAACDHMRRHAERFAECEAGLVDSAAGLSMNEYICLMEAMDPPDGSPRYGGAIELLALAEVLGCGLHVFDVETMNAGVQGRASGPHQPSYSFAPSAEGSLFADDAGDDAWVVVGTRAQFPLLELSLLRTGLHYHLLLSRAERPLEPVILASPVRAM